MESDLMTEYEIETGAPLYDSLTGLYNHGFFLLSLAREIKRSERHGGPLTLALIDIDSFSAFNAHYGPLEGDRILRGIARRILSNIREIDIAARYSGDVFAVILVKAEIESAMVPLERIREAVEKFSKDGPTVSVGLASYPKDASDSNGIIEKTRKALEKAKLRGRNKTCYLEREFGYPTNGRPRILVVDDDRTNVKLLEGILRPMNYQISKAYSGEEALLLVKRMDFDLVLLDAMMPGLNGFEVCRQIKANEDTRLIPVVMLTTLDAVGDKIKGIESGADDFITRPANTSELIARAQSFIKLKNANNKLTSFENILFSLANMVEMKDAYTQGHVERVSNLAMAVGRKFKLADSDIEALRLGGALHDIGKVGVPSIILNKKESLTPEEWEVLRTHPEVGYRVCLPLKKNLGAALDIIRHHHEKLDGSGYPDQLKGDEIPKVAQIMTAVDVYDAVTTSRFYRAALGKEEAFEVMRKQCLEKKLNEEIVNYLSDLVQKR